MNGLVLVDKPAGVTSFDVVRRVRGIVRARYGVKKPKVGHTGTLDPFATGVLPIAIGKATKLAQFLIEGDKSYRATLTLGTTTETDDCDGSVVAQASWEHVCPQAARDALDSLLGELEQMPPKFCALRVDGRRAYAEARAGREVVLQPRRIVIRSMKVLEVDLPTVTFEVTASKGTYIRALCRDVGEQLGCGGHCSDLRRLNAAGFDESGAVPPAELVEGEWGLLSCLDMLRDMRMLTVDRESAEILGHGGWIYTPEGEPADAESIVRVTHDGVRLLCVARCGGGRVQPIRVIDA